jgi:hypothetical protein
MASQYNVVSFFKWFKALNEIEVTLSGMFKVTKSGSYLNDS